MNLDGVEKTVLLVKYLWPVGVIFGLIVIGVQIWGYSSSYDASVHGLGENPSFFELSWDVISMKYHARTRISRGITPQMFIISCLIAGMVVKYIERPKRIYFED
jgi:hypothetical protein